MDDPFHDSKRRQELTSSEPAPPRTEVAAEDREQIAADQVTAELAAADELRSEFTSREKDLSDARRALLARRLRGRSKKAPPAEVIPRRPADAPALLSYSQEQLWFLDQLTPGLPVYNMPFPMRLSGRLDAAALAATFTEILRRHEVLRATFRSVDGKPLMVINPPAVWVLPMVDLAALEAADREEELQRLVNADAIRAFDLVRGPLARFTLLRLADEDHLLEFNVHHIVFDGWSLGVLVRELSALYQAFGAGRASGLEELPIQYGDFVTWQRQRLQGVLASQLDYWKQQLAGAPSVLALPTDRPRPTELSVRGGWWPVELSGDLAEPLAALSRRREATLFMTLLAAFKALLYRHSGQSDLVIGSPIAGRTRKELEGLIGFFVTTVALRTDLAGNPSFHELLSRVRQVAMDAYAHQDVPFEQLVRELAPERAPGSNPLFQVMFVLEHAPAGSAEMSELSLEPQATEGRTARFDLMLVVDEAGFVGMLEYRTDLFDGSTMERLGTHFRCLLQGIVEDPERRLDELPLLSAAETHQLLVAWNDTGAPEPGAAGIHEFFAAQAAHTPEAVAVALGEEQWSYRELARRANRLAHHLRGLGVGPDVMVGVALERSPEAVAALVGVLRAGGVFVPLDRSYPAQRLAFMLEDAGVEVLITRREWLAELPPHEAHTVLLDADREAIAGASADSPASAVAAENLSYLIYTSGSTGRPKGVALVHRTLTNLIAWQLPRSGPAARTLQFAALSFDVSLQEIFATLCSGGTLVLLRDDQRRDPQRLAALLAAQGIERLFLPFVALQQLAEVAAESPPPRLREVITAGEQLQITRQVDRFFTHLNQAGRGGCTLENQYGPSESHVVTAFPLAGPSTGWPALPSIGRPVANFRVYVLDPHRRPVTLGAPGELFLAGGGLARGYHDRPELTAEKFPPDPYGPAGERMYATGDLGRFTAGGEIEFLGRIDHQVKIRGFRIEQGEIEAVLSRAESVRECAVAVRGEGLGGRRLVAYVVAQPGAAAAELRKFLQATLPDYMVPSAFLFLDTLPLLPSGKVDRKALPAPEGGGPEEGFVPPGSPNEELLAGIWAAILGLERVSVNGNFFELGGHSLLATQVVSRMREVFGVEMPVQKLFEAPTVAALAAVIAADREDRERRPPPIRRLPRQGGVPSEAAQLSFAQQRLWFVDQFEPESPMYNLPSAVRVSGRLDGAVLARSLNAIVRRHEALRTTFANVGGEPLQVIAAELELALPQVDLRTLEPEARETESLRLATAENARPFDLSRGPLLRVTVVRLASEEHLILFTMHHIVSDGWSMGVLIRELGTFHAAFSEGHAPTVGELAVQVADHAAWQRRWLAAEVLEEELGYWRGQLGGVPRLELPTDRPRPAVQSFRGRARGFALPAELSGALARLSREHGVTLFMTLLAGFKALLARITGQVDVAVGTPIAGRNRREIEELIGFFVNTLVLRTDLSGGPTSRSPSFRELLQRIRLVTLDAYAHQDLPFERLVEELEPERDLSSTPLFQVMFALQNAPQESLDLPGLTLSPAAAEPGNTAKFDLTLSMQESEIGVVGGLEYCSDLFDATTMDRFLVHFEQLLAWAVADPERRLSELRWWTEAELQQLLLEWNDTAVESPEGRLAHELFAAWAERTPDAVAVVDGRVGEHLSYGELDVRADRLARGLRAQGVGPESVVGVAISPSPELMTTVVGVLKAGGAYLPLDPASPRERLELILEDAGVSVLLASADVMPQFAELAARGITVRGLGSDQPESHEPRPVPATAGTPPLRGNLAYIIYTSGSTGRPKGVAISHDGLRNLLAWHRRRHGFQPGERAHQMASPAFDASVLEIWPALTAGAALYVAGEEPRTSPEKLVDWLTTRAIEVCFLVSPMAELVMAEDWPADSRLRVVLTGGDRLNHRPPSELGFELVNHYGPTETTVLATCGRVAPAGEEPGVPDIGRPIPNARVRVLDRELRPLPAGVAGELCVAGTCLARGYQHQPALTAERFIPDPLSGEPGRRTAGGRLYRTGDLARTLSDGRIEFLGRIDHQVKLRGFRIELGEIEAVLSRSDAVRECVVVIHGEDRGDRALVAYVVPVPGAVADEQDLRELLRRSLPEYMVPSAFVLLSALPLLPSGKVDRRALPAPETMRPEGAFEAPRDPIEELIAEFWAAVLDLEQVGTDESFFDLGGQSLLATQVVSRIREAFEIELPLQALFDAPTVGELAVAVRTLREEQEGVKAPPMVRLERDDGLPRGAVPLSFAQQRLWFLDQFEPASPLYNIPLTMRLNGAISAPVLERVLNEVVRRHEVLRTTFEAVGGRPRQVIAPELHLQVPVVDLEALPATVREGEARRLAAAEELRPYDLVTGPLVRCTLVLLSAEDQVLMLNVHHIAADGWSMGVLMREVTVLYQAFFLDRPSPLPELPLQYADFAHWQGQWLTGEVLEAELDYWRRQLAGVPRLELPTDRPRPTVQTFRGRYLPAALPEELCGSLAALAREQGATLFMTLLAAFKTLLSRWTRQQDIVVGSPIAGRTRREIEDLIGFFVNTLVLRSDLSGQPIFQELLARVRRATLDAYVHQAVPFERLVEELVPERDLGSNPLFQVMFVLQNAPVAEAQLPELRLDPMPLEGGTAKFDLTLLMDGTGTAGLLEYNTDLFDATTIERLGAHFKRLVRGIVEDPERPLGELPLVSAAEAHQLLVDWNDTGAAPLGVASIAELVTAQATRTPERVALVFGDRRVSYRELEGCANRLAHTLRGLGAGPEVPVGMAIERSIDLIVAMLGVFKSGGFLVPLDRTLPADRLAFIIEDAGVELILTRRDSH
ncbi:MAG: amino acid adenylation domain-containing protein, partial [bacterium]|nr:amino acid adenylation domain-containing protein [bacterium]